MRGKTLFPCICAMVLVPLVFIAACSDSGTSPSGNRGFSFDLTVVDDDGAPIEGLKISRVCRIEYEEMPLGWGRSAAPAEMLDPASPRLILTTLEAGLDQAAENVLYPSSPNPGIDVVYVSMDNTMACDLNVNVRNWRGDELAHFFLSLDVTTTRVTLIYSFNSGADYLPNGIFSSAFIATEPGGSTVLFADSVYFAGYTSRDPYRQLIGYTDSDGSFYTKDKGYFPSQQGNQPQMGIDILGLETSLFSFSDTIDVKVMTELPPMTEGVVYWMTREAVVTDGRNEFKWVFVPDDSILVVR